MEFKATADIVEVNRFGFVIQAENKVDAKVKLKEYLENKRRIYLMNRQMQIHKKNVTTGE